MADLSDVETALMSIVLQILYPLGLDQPCISGKPVRVYRGWPITGPLETDLASGVANLSVFAVPDSSRNTTRWGPIVHVTNVVPTLAVQTGVNSVTFSGVGGAGQVAGVLVDGQPFVYRSKAGDTSVLVAATLAESLRQVRPIWLSGATITIPGCIRLIARVVADAATLTEWARQKQDFRLSAWCPDPGVRDHVCSIVGNALAAVSFLTLADNSSARLRYKSTWTDDDNQNAHEYRRDLIYGVEYGTTQQSTAPAMLFGDVEFAGNPNYA